MNHRPGAEPMSVQQSSASPSVPPSSTSLLVLRHHDAAFESKKYMSSIAHVSLRVRCGHVGPRAEHCTACRSETGVALPPTLCSALLRRREAGPGPRAEYRVRDQPPGAWRHPPAEVERLEASHRLPSDAPPLSSATRAQREQIAAQREAIARQRLALEAQQSAAALCAFPSCQHPRRPCVLSWVLLAPAAPCSLAPPL
jgi:hypothetical protein